MSYREPGSTDESYEKVARIHEEAETKRKVIEEDGKTKREAVKQADWRVPWLAAGLVGLAFAIGAAVTGNTYVERKYPEPATAAPCTAFIEVVSTNPPGCAGPTKCAGGHLTGTPGPVSGTMTMTCTCEKP